jgi:hypothetical protein
MPSPTFSPAGNYPFFPENQPGNSDGNPPELPVFSLEKRQLRKY